MGHQEPWFSEWSYFSAAKENFGGGGYGGGYGGGHYDSGSRFDSGSRYDSGSRDRPHSRNGGGYAAYDMGYGSNSGMDVLMRVSRDLHSRGLQWKLFEYGRDARALTPC